jgi:hypothetical protein
VLAIEQDEEKQMHPAVTAVIGAATTSVVLTPVLAFLLRTWIGARIEQSIKHTYDVQLENMRQDIAVKNRAALVSDLLSEWLSRPEDRTRLNRLTFEAFLWLPPDIADALSRRLANTPDAPDVRSIISDVRKYLLGRNDTLDPQKVIIFPPQRAEKTVPKDGH